MGTSWKRCTNNSAFKIVLALTWVQQRACRERHNPQWKVAKQSAPAICREMRPVQPSRRERENLHAVGGHRYRVLELCGEGAVAGHRGPAVGEDLHMRAAQIDHRLDREEHAGLECDA